MIIAYSITQPIKDLFKIVKTIAEGDLSKRAEVKSMDEIGRLASSFNEMADNLQESYKTVEDKVEQRTKQLEELNKKMVGRELKMIELKKEIKKQEKSLDEN